MDNASNQQFLWMHVHVVQEGHDKYRCVWHRKAPTSKINAFLKGISELYSPALEQQKTPTKNKTKKTHTVVLAASNSHCCQEEGENSVLLLMPAAFFIILPVRLELLTGQVVGWKCILVLSEWDTGCTCGRIQTFVWCLWDAHSPFGSWRQLTVCKYPEGKLIRFQDFYIRITKGLLSQKWYFAFSK